ncbi:CBU_0592 family membrane protein [Nocardioides gansuensis]|uniref:CBU_0592 family membrane protein n=1 Tax=Nocardioides gansuensis TaxID=2138300 RepID=UPI003CCBA63F
MSSKGSTTSTRPKGSRPLSRLARLALPALTRLTTAARSPERHTITDVSAHLAIEASGWLAAVLVVLAYGLTTLGRIAARSRTAYALNITGGLGLMINAAANSAWPSAALNLVWLGIAAAGWLRVFPRSARRRPCNPPRRRERPVTVDETVDASA